MIWMTNDTTRKWKRRTEKKRVHNMNFHWVLFVQCIRARWMTFRGRGRTKESFFRSIMSNTYYATTLPRIHLYLELGAKWDVYWCGIGPFCVCVCMWLGYIGKWIMLVENYYAIVNMRHISWMEHAMLRNAHSLSYPLEMSTNWI